MLKEFFYFRQVTLPVFVFDRTCSRRGSRIFCRGGGGGVNDGRVQRAPSGPAPTGGSRVDKHQIKVGPYIASIEYSERFLLLFFLL